MGFSPFSAAFDGRNRPLSTGHGWTRIASLGGGHHYDPSQPRVPAGYSDGGRWTRVASSDGSRWTRVASNEPPRPPDSAGKRSNLPSIRRAAPGRPRVRGRGGIFGTILEIIYARMMEEYRKKYADRDLLGYVKSLKDGVIAVARIDGKPVFGVNSTFSTYTDADDRAAKQLRDVLVRNYPHIMATDNIGKIPNDAVFHAETTLLLRAAKANGGMLAGKTIDVLVEKKPCDRSCEKVLPLIGLELGNPTVTFTSRDGETQTMRDGRWQN